TYTSFARPSLDLHRHDDAQEAWVAVRFHQARAQGTVDLNGDRLAVHHSQRIEDVSGVEASGQALPAVLRRHLFGSLSKVGVARVQGERARLQHQLDRVRLVF